MLNRSHRTVGQLLKHCYGVRYMATATKIDLMEQIETYPYLHTFLFDKDDPLKKRWDFIRNWSIQCEGNPEMEEKNFKLLRQRYELAPLYENESIMENNDFLKDIFSRIKDPTIGINRKTLTDKQLEVTSRIMSENIAVAEFQSKIPQLLKDAEETIRTLRFKKFDFTEFERSLHSWSKYKFLSYGHCQIVKLREKMIEDGGILNAEDIKAVVYYMRKVRYYTFHNKEFNEAMKWMSRMNWVFYHDSIFQGMEDNFVLIHDCYERMKEVLENDDTLKRCQYSQKTDENNLFTPETKDIEVWLRDISKKGDDPLVIWLQEKLCSEAALGELQDAIVNRFQLDIGGLYDKHENLLKSLLQNKYLHEIAPDIFDTERHKLLTGVELTQEYLDELKGIVANAQQQFAAKRK